MKKVISMSLVMVMLALTVVGCGSAPAESTNVNETKTENSVAPEETQTEESAAPADTTPSEGNTVGFVTFGLGGDFFQQLADAFVAKFESAGWKASYADGKFDPTAQMEACENYIAMGVDVLVIWAVAPEAMDAVVQSAMDAGIKVISFVAKTSDYDALMVSDNALLADYDAKLAAKWIDSVYADAEDHSVPVAVLSCRTADTGVVQADELLKIEDFSTKAKFVTEVQCKDENKETGLSAAENLYITNPEIKVFLSAHNGLALGINSYFTGMSSPVKDYSDMGIFTINGDDAAAEIIKSSINDEALLRGMVLTGSVDDTAQEIMDVCTGVLDGTLEKGYVQQAGTTFVNEDTVNEYLETGKVTSLTAEDFK